MAGAVAAAVRRAGGGADVLALMPEAGRALPDGEAAGLAEIVPPRIDLGLAGLVPVVLLRTDAGRGFLERKTNLRIGDRVGAAAAPARAAVGDDVAARAVAEVGRP